MNDGSSAPCAIYAAHSGWARTKELTRLKAFAEIAAVLVQDASRTLETPAAPLAAAAQGASSGVASRAAAI